MSDHEVDFHPAESDRNTEQAAQSMSKKNGASISLVSKCKDNEELYSHPSHRTKLTLLQHEESEEKIKYCMGCLEVMCFPGYACTECEFCLHKTCAELPPKILHPLHPHPLTFLSDDDENIKILICDGCRDLCTSGFTFSCSWCGFNLDAKCASKQDQEYHKTFKKLTLYRFYHKHALKLCNVPKFFETIVAGIRCCCCRQIISTGSSAYCCMECDEMIIIHESCTEIPMEIYHPFHSQHIVVAQTVSQYYYGSCDACKSSIEGIKIGCNECHFQLHVSCANPNRWASPLKHNCHEHNMYYFVEDDTTGSSVDDSDKKVSFVCNKCHEKCLKESFYRCVKCDFNLHLKCIPVPRVVMITQKHRHPLTLIDSVKEDNPLIQYLMDLNDKVDYSMNYYCDICETPGNPKRHAYCCEECIYIAHVECIISEDNTPLENPSNLNLKHGTEPKKEQKMSDEADFHQAESDRSTEQAAQSMSKKNGATSDDESNEELFDHSSHHHELTLLQQEPTNGGSSEEKIKYCNGCNEVMCFPGYACHECKFYLHKSCAELPPTTLHPLHPHPLTSSLSADDFEDDEVLICDGCRDLYAYGFKFRCSWCGFNLDAKCASKQDQEYHQTFKELTLYRFYHKHALKLCNVPKTEHPKLDEPIRCCCCRQIISTGSSAYCCLECEIIIHESCTEIPMEVHHPFHPQHILLTQPIEKKKSTKRDYFYRYNYRYDYRSCDACKSTVKGIKIGCNECDFELHVSCANPSRYAYALKNNSHQHNMYYFVEDDTAGSFECNKCHEKCLVDEAFYRCVECDFNLHFKCIPIPSVVTVTQKHHHPLTLIDSVREDNPFIQYLMDSNDKVDYSMDYYCDDCEKPGNPKHHAYYCKECIYIAHVECIISKENTSSEILSNLNPTHGTEPKKEQNNTSDEGDFHPAELDCGTEQAAQNMSKNGATFKFQV